MSGIDGLRYYRDALSIPVSEGNRVWYYIGGNDTFQAMRAAIEEATRPDAKASFVYLLGWHLDTDTPMPGKNGSKDQITFEEVLRQADKSGVQIRAMLWNNPLSSNTTAVAFINSLWNGAAILDSSAPSDPNPGASHHQKILVVRGARGLIGFCGGLDISKDRIQNVWRPRGSPLHDVHCEIRGPAANKLLAIFVERWQSHLKRDKAEEGKEHLRVIAVERGDVASPATPARGEQLVSIATTMNLLVHRTYDAVSGTNDEYCAQSRSTATVLAGLIRAARKFIYFEEQYLTNLKLADLLNSKLKLTDPQIQHITVLVTHQSISDEPGIEAARTEFVKRVRAGLKPEQSERFRVYYRLFDESHIKEYRYIHSKLWIIDDVVAVVGSANATARSWWFDSEASAVIMDDPPAPGRSFAKRLRAQAWAGHLGVKPIDVWSAETLELLKKWWDDASRKGNLVRPYELPAKPGHGSARFFDPEGDFRRCARP